MAGTQRKKYRISGGKKNGYAVLTPEGAIEYDLLESRDEAVAIRDVINSGIGPEWDVIRDKVEERLASLKKRVAAL